MNKKEEKELRSAYAELLSEVKDADTINFKKFCSLIMSGDEARRLKKEYADEIGEPVSYEDNEKGIWLSNWKFYFSFNF